MMLDIQKVKLIMMKQCMSKTQLAQRAGISYGTLSFALNHDRQLNFASIGKIAKALDVDPSEIVKE